MKQILQPEYKGSSFKVQFVFSILYYIVYIVYLFISLENEFFHWLSMVIIPFSLWLLIFKKYSPGNSIKLAFTDFGMDIKNIKKGIFWALLIGLFLSGLQLLLSRDHFKLFELFKSGAFIYKLPLSLLLMFCTAGFTEEFFFRGFLVTRFKNYFTSNFLAVGVSSILFGLYHLPYAYLSPHWPSCGNLNEAFESSLGLGIPVGLILGIIYIKAKNNLLAPIIVHSLLNSFPGMLAINF